MISEDVWILIGVNANKSDGPLLLLFLRTTDRLEVIYIKVLDPFQGPPSCLIKAVIME
jgi:hypothetical protein